VVKTRQFEGVKTEVFRQFQDTSDLIETQLSLLESMHGVERQELIDWASALNSLTYKINTLMCIIIKNAIRYHGHERRIGADDRRNQHRRFMDKPKDRRK